MFSAQRGSYIDPVNSGVEADLVFSLYSDSLVIEVFPLMYLRTAVTHLTYQHQEVLGGEQWVNLEIALRAATINPAKQLGIDDIGEMLEVGGNADLVILKRNPREVDARNLDKL